MSANTALAQCSSSKSSNRGNTVYAASMDAHKTGTIVDTAVANGNFNTLVAAVKAAGLADALSGDGPLTVFAPTDAAFAKLPHGTVESLLKPKNKASLQAILKYHVVSGDLRAEQVLNNPLLKTLNGQAVNITTKGGKAMIDGATITATDVACSNGVIHVIDEVILPASKNIVGVAQEAGSFNTLIAAAKAGGLVPALTGDGPITVFAPTDAAFAKLPKGTVESLLKPENKHKLAEILKYHVVKGRVYSTDAVKAGKAKTLEGGKIKIKADAHGAKVNDANLVKTDIDATNGVIHVIDTVLMP